MYYLVTFIARILILKFQQKNHCALIQLQKGFKELNSNQCLSTDQSVRKIMNHLVNMKYSDDFEIPKMRVLHYEPHILHSERSLYRYAHIMNLYMFLLIVYQREGNESFFMSERPSVDCGGIKLRKFIIADCEATNDLAFTRSSHSTLKYSSNLILLFSIHFHQPN